MSEPTVTVRRKWQTPLLLLTFLVFLSAPLAAQQRVTGRVTAAAGSTPVVGVSVQVLGTTVFARTNDDGRYTILAPSATSVLAFSRIGFMRREVTLQGQSTVDVTLAQSAAKLDEVVVVGYGEKLRATP